MAALNLTELAQMAVDLQALVGAQLQECVQSESEMGLGFYHDRQMVWLWIDFHPQRPMLVRLAEPPARKKVQRPLTLFIRSRFEGRRIESLRADLSRGRVLVIEFHRSQDEPAAIPPRLELFLIPHAANLIAIDGKSQVAENKPKELPVSQFVERDEPVVRSLEQLTAEWLAQQKTPQAHTDANAREKKFQKAVEKKSAALERMREELAQKTSNKWRELGEWLKANGTLEGAPGEVNNEESLSWNIEHAFHRAKENERKAEGTRDRIAQVTQELLELQKLGPAKFDLPQKGVTAKQQQSLLAKAAARGRRHQIGDLEVYIGKSAQDNLAILRKAQPFDLWLHLRDFPGAHAILRRTRGRNVTDHELQEAGAWVVEQSLGKRAQSGERYDMLIVECRYVRPIKGDKLGRVNYTNDRVMTLRY